MSTFGGGPSIKLGFFEDLSIAGSAAVIAHCLVHPIDVMKIRMQVNASARGQSIYKTFTGAVRNEGVLFLGQGLTACATRHMVYSSLRLGAYPIVRAMLTKPGEVVPLYKKIFAASSTGFLGSMVGNPNDVILVRMQAGNSRGYRNVFHGLYSAVKNDGVLSLWRGCVPTVLRATVLNAGQLASYDQIKQLLVKSKYFGDGTKTHLVASTLAGFIAIGVSNPIDVIKTRIMNMKVDPATGKAEYRGVIDCAKKIAKNEGFMGFYKGLVPACSRTVPVTILLLMIYEKIYRLFIFSFHKDYFNEHMRKKK